MKRAVRLPPGTLQSGKQMRVRVAHPYIESHLRSRPDGGVRRGAASRKSIRAPNAAAQNRRPSQPHTPRIGPLLDRWRDGQPLTELKKPLVWRRFVRVSDGTRTRDRLDHNQELYRLSYAHRDVRNVAVDLAAAARARGAVSRGGSGRTRCGGRAQSRRLPGPPSSRSLAGRATAAYGMTCADGARAWSWWTGGSWLPPR